MLNNRNDNLSYLANSNSLHSNSIEPQRDESKSFHFPSFSFPLPVVGIEVLREKISAVALRYKKRRWTIDKTVTKSIPPPLDASMIANKIAEVLDELDIKSKQIVTCLNSSDMIVKILSLPPLQHPEQELPQLMAYELERQLPIPLSQAAYDYQIIQPPDAIDASDATTVLLAAVRHSKLKEHLDLMASAGVFPKAVMPSFLMFLNTLFACGLPTSGELGFVGAVRLSESIVDVVVLEGGVLSFARSFAPKMETSYDFLGELRNTLRDFLPPNGRHQLEKLLIITVDESMPFNLTLENLIEALAFSHCEHKMMRDGFTLGLTAGHLNIPYALSLNLMKPLLKEQRAKENMARRERALRFGPVTAMLVLAVTAIFLFNQTETSQKKLIEAKEAQQVFERKVEEKKNLKKLSSDLSRQIETLQWVDAGYPPLSYRLYQVAISTPRNVLLKEVNTPPQPKRQKKEIPVMDTLIVTGYASSQSDIEDFIQQLRQHSCFAEIRQDNTEERIMNKQKVLLFQLSLKSSPVNANE